MRIIRSRSTEDFSSVLYNMTLLNCLLPAWYGLPFVSPDNILVSTVNGAGAAIEAGYVVIFLIFASKPSIRARTAALLAAVLSAFGAVAVISLALLDGRPRKLFCRLRGLRLLHLHVRVAAVDRAAGDQDQERGVHAVPALAVRLPVRHLVVRLRIARPRSLRLGAEWLWKRAGGNAAAAVRHLQEEQQRAGRKWDRFSGETRKQSIEAGS